MLQDGTARPLFPETLSGVRQFSEAQILKVQEETSTQVAQFSCPDPASRTIRRGHQVFPQSSPSRHPDGPLCWQVLFPSLTELLSTPGSNHPALPSPVQAEHSLTLHRAGWRLCLNSPEPSNVSQLTRTDLTEQDYPLGGSRLIVFTPKPGPI